MGIPGTVKSIADASLEGMDVMLNASPLGMTGKPPLALSPAAMNRYAIIFDMVYAPLETPLLRQSRSLGVEAVDGLQKPLAQAAGRSEECRVGKECVSECRCGRSQYSEKQKRTTRPKHT